MKRLLLLLLAACGRDLTLPPQALPPKVTAVDPAEGFADDFITLTGENLADPSVQVLFDVRPAVIVTPAAKRDGHTLEVQVPQNVLGGGVSVTTSQGTAKWDQSFHYLGLGHPRTVALRATLQLEPFIELVMPLADGATAAVLDSRYGTVRARSAGGGLSNPAQIAKSPALAFGPPAAAWIVDDPYSGYILLQQFDLTADPPAPGPTLSLHADSAGADGSPAGDRLAIPDQQSLKLVSLPSGAVQQIDLPGVSDTVAAVRFWDNDQLIGVTYSEAFRVDLSGATPVVTVGPLFPNDAGPEGTGHLTLTAPPDQVFAYVGPSRVYTGSWGDSVAPQLTGSSCAPLIPADSLAITNSAQTVLVGSDRAVAACHVALGGGLDSVTDLPGLTSLHAIEQGPEKGYVLAGLQGGDALLFPGGSVALREGAGLDLRGTAVDPKCGDVIVATAYGPLFISRDTLVPSQLDVSLQLSTVQGGEGGVAGLRGADVFAYQPVPTCDGKGHFVKVATADSPPVVAALSGDGTWVATSDGEDLELLPRTDATTLPTKAKLLYPRGGDVFVAWSGNQLTVVHPATPDYAITNYAPGTLQEKVSEAMPPNVSQLHRVRFAQAWLVDSLKENAQGEVIATTETVWSAEGGVLASQDVAVTVTQPAGISADGFMLVGFSSVAVGLDTLILQISQGRLIPQPGPHVDLPGQADDVLPSPDGGRLYVSMPSNGALAVVE